jgi:hypothetical protein
MAANRHNGFQKRLYFRNGSNESHEIRNTHEKEYFSSEVPSKVALLEIQDGGRPPYLICKML